MSDRDTVQRALALLAEQEETFAQSSGSGISEPDDGVYHVILRSLTVSLGSYGKYRTGKDGPEEADTCVFVVPVVEVFDHPEMNGRHFSLGFFSNREGSGTRKMGNQDFDRLKSLFCGLLGININDWTTTQDMMERSMACENVGQYVIRVKRRTWQGQEFVNKDLVRQLPNATR